MNQNREPSSTADWTPITPPARSTSKREIANPNPAPPYTRVEEPSTCENGWNNLCIPSLLIPMPVSLTSARRKTSVDCNDPSGCSKGGSSCAVTPSRNISRSSRAFCCCCFPCSQSSAVLAQLIRTATFPASGVNLIAFEIRLTRTCRNRPASARMEVGNRGGKSMTKTMSMPFFPAISATKSSILLRNGRSSNSVSVRINLSASIFEKSRMSFTIVRRDSLHHQKKKRVSHKILRFMKVMSTNLALKMVDTIGACSKVSSVSRSSSESPMIAFKGVRSS